ncbi:MAG: hypothetical protein KF817_03570 [Phycisphaeraceae bacterium]|nr:hypothetical protein [Phycisphaeraceae bacterium]
MSVVSLPGWGKNRAPGWKIGATIFDRTVVEYAYESGAGIVDRARRA